MFLTLAVHHPKPEHVEDFVAFTRTIEREMEGTPGFHSRRDPEWSAAPDELFLLSQA